MTNQSWAFFGGLLVKNNQGGYVIQLNEGGHIHLTYNEAQSLSSLLTSILFRQKSKEKRDV